MQRTLAQILKRIRLDRGFSQENVAEEIEVDVTTYGRYEKGESQIKFEQVARLANFYGITIDNLYHYDETRPSLKAEKTKSEPKRQVTVMVTLDGLEGSLKSSIELLNKINNTL